MCECQPIKGEDIRVGDIYHHMSHEDHTYLYIALAINGIWNEMSRDPLILCHRILDDWSHLQYTPITYSGLYLFKRASA